MGLFDTLKKISSNGGKGHKSMDWIKDINQYEGFQ